LEQKILYAVVNTSTLFNIVLRSTTKVKKTQYSFLMVKIPPLDLHLILFWNTLFALRDVFRDTRLS